MHFPLSGWFVVEARPHRSRHGGKGRSGDGCSERTVHRFLFVPDNQRTDATDSIALMVGVYEGKSNEHVQPADMTMVPSCSVAN
jgi:hypothetical protein